MTVSHWRRASTRADRLECDALVIGAGVCGVSAAIAFARAGLHTLVIDRGPVAGGASSRNAGFLMRGAADHYADAIRLYGHGLAKTLWRWTEENLAGLRGEGCETLPSYRRIPSALLALNDGQARELREAEGLLRADGFNIGWAESSIGPFGPDSAFKAGGVLGALVNPDDASVNPVELVELLAAKARASGATIFENREVFGVEGDDEGATVRSADLVIRARRVLICLNAYAPLLIPELAGIITPRRGQMIALDGTGLRLDASYYANHGSEYFRSSADGTVVVGGCRTYFADREVGFEDTTTSYVQSALETFAARALGIDGAPAVRARLKARWAGTMGFSPDGLPLVGPVDDLGASARYGANVWFCGGFTGHGMSMGYRTAQSAVEGMLEGKPTPLPMRRVRGG